MKMFLARPPGSGLPAFSQRQLTVVVFTALLATFAMSSSQASEGAAGQMEGFAAMQQMDLQALGETRAREGEKTVNLNTVQSIQEMQASVTDTSFDVGGDMVSGNISFAPGALGGYSGTGIFSAVTGNGNSINNAVGISVFINN